MAPTGLGPGRRLVAAAGLVAVALTLPALLLVEPAPPLGTSTEEIVAYYGDAGRPFLIYSWLVALSLPFLLAHLAAVAEWLRRQGQTGLAAPYLVGGLMAHTVQLVLLAIFQLAGMAALRGDAGTTRTLADFGNVGLSFCALAELVRQVAGGMAIRRTGVLPRWVSWLPFAGAGLCVLGSVGLMTRSGPLAAGSLPVTLWAVGFLVTFAVVNAVLLLQRETGRPAPADGGPGRHRRPDGPGPAAGPEQVPAAPPGREQVPAGPGFPLPQRREPVARADLTLLEPPPLPDFRAPLTEFRQAARPPPPAPLPARPPRPGPGPVREPGPVQEPGPEREPRPERGPEREPGPEPEKPFSYWS